jgi:hypothetical protein
VSAGEDGQAEKGDAARRGLLRAWRRVFLVAAGEKLGPDSGLGFPICIAFVRVTHKLGVRLPDPWAIRELTIEANGQSGRQPQRTINLKSDARLLMSCDFCFRRPEVEGTSAALLPARSLDKKSCQWW